MLSVLVSGSTERFFLFDALGSTDRLLATNQGVTDQYLYEAFGKEVFWCATQRRQVFFPARPDCFGAGFRTVQ